MFFEKLFFHYIGSVGIFCRLTKFSSYVMSFFQLDPTVKQKYARPASGSGHGWVAFEREK